MQAKNALGMIFLSVLLSIALTTLGLAAVPGQISFQGQLVDDTGVPVPDGTYTMRFYLFDADTGGTQLWNSSDGEVQPVDVANGIYTVQLGAVDTLSSSIFADGTAWLQVDIYNPDTSIWEPLSPRQPVTSVAYALKAGDADTLEGYTAANLDARYVNENQANAVTSAMIQNDAITAADLGVNSVGTSEIATAGVGSSEVADNSLTFKDILDGSGSKLDADLLDGADSSSFFILNQNETVTGSPAFNGGATGSTPPFYVDSTYRVSNLNADYLDGYNYNYFMPAATDNWVNVTGDSMTGPLDVTTTHSNLAALKGVNSYDTFGYLGVQGAADFDGITSAEWFGHEIGVAGISVGTSSSDNYGVRGHSNYVGVRGEYSEDPANNYGDLGRNGYGVYGRGTEYGGYFEGTDSTSYGVYGKVAYSGSGAKYAGYFVCDSDTGYGVYATVNGSYTNYAVRGIATGTGSDGAWFSTTSKGHNAVYATATSTSGTDSYDDAAGGRFDSDGLHGYGVYARADGTYGTGIYARGGASGYAAHFSGNVRIANRSTGATVMELGEGLDYAEGFNVTDMKKPEPGSVLIIDPKNPGQLTLSTTAYDTKVAGIVAGARGLGSGIRLGADRFDNDVALAGRVYCRVDATRSPVKTGDLLTTGDLPGYAMKVDDYTRAQGAVLGKAMENLNKGEKGKILVLVTLQ